MTNVDDAGWYQIITAFPNALTTVGWLREDGGWFIPDPTFNEASVVGARLSRLIPESETLEPTGALNYEQWWRDAENEVRALQSRIRTSRVDVLQYLIARLGENQFTREGDVKEWLLALIAEIGGDGGA